MPWTVNICIYTDDINNVLEESPKTWRNLLYTGGGEFSRKPLMRCRSRTHRQALGIAGGHAASGAGPGVQNVLLGHFELTALGGRVALPHGDQDGVLVPALHPLLGLHGWLGSRCVGVEVILEQVRLRREEVSYCAARVCFFK